MGATVFALEHAAGHFTICPVSAEPLASRLPPRLRPASKIVILLPGMSKRTELSLGVKLFRWLLFRTSLEI
jgi:hypothetical protein